MASVADGIYALHPADVPTAYAWLAAACYYFQIYFDFSGYSDMAIGLGRMMGLEFLENFQRPYVAKTFTEFWRRWHISLSNWMREYLYIPLGGNRVAPWRGYLNLWIVFLVSGFWHGAAWNFVIWGAYQGVFLTIDRIFWAKIAEKIPALLLRLKMVFLVMISWVIFRSETMDRAFDMFGCMFGGNQIESLGSRASLLVGFDRYTQCIFCLATVISFLPWSETYMKLEQRFVRWRTTLPGTLVSMALVSALLFLSVLGLVNSTHTPFIYFRF